MRADPFHHGAAGLGLGQLFAVIFGFLITSALIFLFGIWVGRDITERRLAQEERVVRVPIPVQPSPSVEAGSTDVDLSFYEKLKEKAVQRLQETVAAESTPTPRAVAGRAAPERGTNPQPVRPPAAAVPAPRGVPTPAHQEWADAGWTVQVNATTNPRQANDLAQALRTKGYDAYTVQAPMRGQTWYRVRVGRFPSRQKAKELETRLKHLEGLENAYATPQ